MSVNIVSGLPRNTTPVGDIAQEIADRIAADNVLDSRLDVVEPQVSTLESQMTVAQSDIVVLDSRLDITESNIVALDSRLDVAEPKVSTLESKMAVQEPKVSTLESNMTVAQSQITVAGVIPVGSIFAWQGGYFANNSNGTFTNVLGNTIANANAYLNQFGIYVCDGSALNVAGSPIFNGAGRYLPNLTGDRFLMGSTTAGGIGGDNSNAHTHSVTSNVSATVPAHYHGFSLSTSIGLSGSAPYLTGTTGFASTGHTHLSDGIGSDGNTMYKKGSASGETVTSGGYVGSLGWSYSAGAVRTGYYTGGPGATASVGIAAGSYSLTGSNTVSGTIGNTGGSNGNSAYSATVTNNTVTSGAASVTENRPLYLSIFYVIRVK